MFHDFLGTKPFSTRTDSPVAFAPAKNPPPDASPSASLSAGAASSPAGGGGGGGSVVRCPPSTTFDLASERQVGNHLEGIPFYGPTSDISGPEISNRSAETKRSNSASAFLGSSRDKIPHMAHESLDSLHLLKILKNGGGGERAKRSNDDEVLYGRQAMRPTSASIVLQSATGSRLDANVTKWERSIPMGTAMQYPPHVGRFVVGHQVPVNKSRDINSGTSIISQTAADEGSRTGIKGPGILSSVNAGCGISEKNPPWTLPSGSILKFGANVSEPESSSTPSSRQSLTSSRQMTIFYGGQAHVFDDVHPNKADIIMALAGSHGGSWSTTYSPKPTARPGAGQSNMTSRENETGTATGATFQHDFHGRLSGNGATTNRVTSGD